MLKRTVATVLAAAVVCFAVTAHADDGADEVTLKNGGAIRGTVVSSEPGTSVRIIELGQKEARTIPWGEVADVERGKYATATTAQPASAGAGYAMAPPPVATLPAPEPKLGAPGVVRLHVDSPQPVVIYQHGVTQEVQIGARIARFEQARAVCSSPCDRVVDGSGGQTFSAAGDFPAPSTFTVDQLKGDVRVDVRPGSTTMRKLGLGGIIGGLTGAAMGGLFWGLGAASQSESGRFASKSDPLPTIGAGILVASGVLLAGGIVLYATSGSRIKLKPKTDETTAMGAAIRAAQSGTWTF
jgi:hypothetical protein